MNITLGVTDNAWASYLRAHDTITEANFWVPSARDFTGRSRLDEPFLFKTKRPDNALVGGGYKSGFWQLRVSEAWAVFGEGNGVASEEDLLAAIQVYRDRNRYPWSPDPTIGCLILRNLFFAPAGEELSQPEAWGRSIVQGRTYTPDDVDYDYVEHAYRAFQGGARVDLVDWDSDLRGVDLEEDLPRFGAPVLTRQRLGQGGFRISVLQAYDRRCAITGSRLAPALQAAHIRPYADGGRHVVPNGLLLRSDIHTLFDRGYLGVDEEYHLRVSPWLRTDFGNGDEFYERQERDELIRLPSGADNAPDRDELNWHQAHVFKRAA